jgi:hypothetical protein
MSDLGRKGLGEQAQEKRTLTSPHPPSTSCNMLTPLSHSPVPEVHWREGQRVCHRSRRQGRLCCPAWYVYFVTHLPFHELSLIPHQRATSPPPRSSATPPAVAATQPRRRAAACSTPRRRVSATLARLSPTHSTRPLATRSRCFFFHPPVPSV